MANSTSDLWLAHLKEEGFAPKADDEGHIHFKAEGLQYIILIEEGDLNFFRLILPGIYTAPDDAALREAVQAANEATSSTKVAKVFLQSNGSFWGSVELFVEKPENAIPVFSRCMSALRAAVNTFAKAVQ